MLFTVLLGMVYAGIAVGPLDTTYIQDFNLSGFTPAVQGSITVRSARECGGLCSLYTSCRGFYHSVTAQECFLDMDVYFDSFHIDTLARYFEKNQLDALTTADPTVLSANCPSNFTEDITLQGSNGITYTFRFLNTIVSQMGAVSACNNLGLRLVKLDDDNKAESLMEFLRNCPVYHGAGYWTDIRRDEDDGEWRTSDEDAVSSSVWCGGQAGDGLMEYCARLNNECDFRLNDMVCVMGYRAICE